MHSIQRLTLVIISLQLHFAYSKNLENKKSSLNLGDPLFLTPYIEQGRILEARELSRVQNLSPAMTSYSGFMTVNATYDANMFFWFFPAQISPSNAPVIMWCEGGPGVSGLYSLFNENGPYVVDKFQNLTLRQHSWNLDYNIIFTDNPIGAGFSFTNSTSGYLKSGTDPAHLYNFLTQFYKMFPEYAANEFYASGVSFGGIFAPTIAHEIHLRNQDIRNPKINLKGLLVESGWSDPIRQVDYGDFLYGIGFLDKFDRDFIKDETELLKEYIASGRWAEAHKLWGAVIVNSTGYFLNRTKMDNEVLYNYIGHGSAEDTSEYYVPFIEQELVRNSIHVGNTKYIPINPNTMTDYEDKGFGTVKPFIETLLAALEGYKILYYAGQLDVITYHLGVRNIIDGLEWSGAEEFRQSRSNPWKANGVEVSGFATNAFNLTYVLMRNAGHDANSDKPEWGLDVVRRFTRGLSFTG